MGDAGECVNPRAQLISSRAERWSRCRMVDPGDAQDVPEPTAVQNRSPNPKVMPLVLRGAALNVVSAAIRE